MSTRVIICGGRTYHLAPEDYVRLDVLLACHRITEVIHGGATGVDREAGDWAQSQGIPCKPFPVAPEDWTRLGKAAGPIRNNQMLRYLQRQCPGEGRMVIAFPGGRGTADMIAKAQRAGITVHVVTEEPL